ncbi:YicC family protein [Piscinibacter sp. Jin2]|uniref:YicC family protein n=1 Tax=Aquariibacter lacus TaxID=2801332 RepID=A0A9X0XG74_9BURK|nr:YicC/YloC family endoribonuclease [Piscinibacter lacus]MBL0719398.1 YicC family protein [Piscinibacter lacus]
MPVYSMTGYAQALADASAPSVSDPAPAPRAGSGLAIDIRSVNSRFLDLAFRLPDELRGLEPALRELIAGSLKRGKVELRIATREGSETAWPQPQMEQLTALARLEGSVRNWLPQAAPLSVHEVLTWCRGGGSAVRSDEQVLALARQALAGLSEARAREGAKLVEILQSRITRLRELAAEAGPLLPQVVARQQQRFLERWQDALAAADGGGSIPADTLRDRALTEAASYAIRIDVAEELGRLNAHLDEIERLLKKGGELGKRLDFLIQELHREANTLGSKSAALELTQISVEMKVAIEQMREQVQNIE